MILRLKNVVLPLAHFRLEVEVEIRGRFTALFGPSGSGKTSLLDFIAGLRRAETAFLQIDRDVLTDTAGGVLVPPRRRGIGYVPQDLALFPHLSVRHNLLYGQRREADPRFHLTPVVELLELEPLIERGVGQLSGGEKQRVALARALLSSPRLLLLDEPLASLDLPLKAKILPYLARIRDEFRIPILYVTHDRFETLSLADEMVVMAEGKIVQTGPVAQVLSRPASVAAASILTVETVQPGRIVRSERGLVTVAIGSALVTGIETTEVMNATEVFICIRAENVILAQGTDQPSSARNHLPATVQCVSRAGPLMRVDLDCGFPLAALLTQQACEDLRLVPGSRLLALVKAPHVHLIRR